MTLVIDRKIISSVAFIGELYIDNKFECYTLENPDLDIPTGTYPVTLEFSPRFQMITPHLQNVPNRTFIEIHPGNTEKDTEGCILVGQTHTISEVLNSRIAFNNMMPKLKEPMSITIQ